MLLGRPVLRRSKIIFSITRRPKTSNVHFYSDPGSANWGKGQNEAILYSHTIPIIPCTVRIFRHSFPKMADRRRRRKRASQDSEEEDESGSGTESGGSGSAAVKPRITVQEPVALPPVRIRTKSEEESECVSVPFLISSIAFLSKGNVSSS